MDRNETEPPSQYIIQVTERGGDEVVGYAIAEQVRFITAKGGQLAPEAELVLGSLRDMFARGERLAFKALPLPPEEKPGKGRFKIVARVEGASVDGASVDDR